MTKPTSKTSGELFAFKLATKKSEHQSQKRTQWQTRDGVSAAGCTVNLRGHVLCPSWGDGGNFC
ncbi:MAG: hypothetical protein AAF184_01385 [Pseudomonadota bacterium]